MGVYHFMGLGRSPGAVTAAISYLAARYQRYNPSDEAFFSSSGEVGQTGKRGDAQALVLFTTAEVYEGSPNGWCSRYKDNKLGTDQGVERPSEKMQDCLARILKHDLAVLAGGRCEFPVYWCEVDRADLGVTFERVVQVFYATKPSGKLGKEIWVNLTGGSNVVNIALQLASALASPPARVYYVQSDDIALTRPSIPLRVIGTDDDRFWVELPVVYLTWNNDYRAVLECLQGVDTGTTESDLLSRLKQEHSQQFCGVGIEHFRRTYLVPLEAQQLIIRENQTLRIGPRWESLRGYYTALTKASESQLKLEQLELSEAWFHHQVLDLR